MFKNKKILVIVAGAAGEIGEAYCRRISDLGIDVIGVVRNHRVEGVLSENFRQVHCQLDNSEMIRKVFDEIDIESYRSIIFLHSIGMDKFNPRNYPDISKLKTIDSDVYDTNVNSFKYLFRYLTKRVLSINSVRKEMVLKTAVISGVADMYAPFVIEDFCEAKLILRGYIRSYVDKYPDLFSGLSINITSTLTKSAAQVRPHADKSDWLSPDEVVSNSIGELLSIEFGYKEINLIKPSKRFIEGYYENEKLLYEKWVKETGFFLKQ